MVVKCKDSLKKRVFQYTKNLKGKTNELDKSYYVEQQQPKEWNAEWKDLNAAIGKIKDQNSKIQESENKIQYHVKKRQLYMNNELQRKRILPPQFSDMVKMTEIEKAEVVALPIMEEVLQEEKGNIFRARACKVTSLSDIRKYYLKMKLLYPEADHIIAAY